jgi:prepilin-type N-terminal cleavage/methylation domain-containing protein
MRDLKRVGKGLKMRRDGFTLIELLIVIAILGVLTTAVLVAINPLEQFARSRDSGRKNMVNQLGHAIQNYYTAQNATYPPVAANWMTALQTSQDIKTIPDNVTTQNNPTTPCAAPGQLHNNICYNANASEAVVYAVQGSRSEQVKAGGGVTPCATVTFVVWSSAAGRTGLYCNATGPAPGITALIF